MNKILLIRDDCKLTFLLKRTIGIEGFQIQMTHNGKQELNQLNYSIDLLLLDVMMPHKMASIP